MKLRFLKPPLYRFRKILKWLITTYFWKRKHNISIKFTPNNFINPFGNTIIAFLTARGEDYSQIAGFDAGADDYITKPIKPKVLISRIKALLKRYRSINKSTEETTESIIEKGSLKIDTEKFLIYKEGKEIVLPRKEFALLLLLVSKPQKVFTREEIFSKVWGNDIIVGDRTIDVHIRKLREKIGDDLIHTVKGVGYKFVI